MSETSSILVGRQTFDSVLSEQRGKAHGDECVIARVLATWHQVSWRSIQVRHEVGLIGVVLEDKAKEIITQPKIDRQLRTDLPVVLRVTSIIIFAVVRQ